MSDATKTTDEKKPVDEQKPNYSPIGEDERNARKLKINIQKLKYEKSMPSDYKKK
ncbi:MAG: hypothetical protein LBC04_02840 [Holosporaceae bacterium]|jgi:hypothetical protein|nr:hypothetical protein [Holosporaceae bacterium]